MSKETIEFKAEVSQVLNLVIHSLYSHREVFLRELISNSADAIDKRRFESLTHPEVADASGAYEIRILPDKDKKTLTIHDNGIGMTRDEVVRNIGTIAASGSRAFLEKLKENQTVDAPSAKAGASSSKAGKASPQAGVELIGQFGVGFYSAFMVAERVEVITQSAAGGPAVHWESSGEGGYSIEETTRTGAGTDVILHLRDEAQEFLEEWQISSIIQKYSDYVPHPVILEKKGGEKETLNKVTAIWRRPKSEIKEEEYAEFYKYVSHNDDEPLAWTHHTIEGGIEFRLLLFIPKKAPLNLFREDSHSLRLHVKRMFVTEDLKGLIPVFLRFVKGVVDSEDLPLNVSRETLQHNALIPKMQKQITKKVIEMLEDLAKNEPEKYKAFFKEFGAALKEGLGGAFDYRERLVELMRYPSTAVAESDRTSLSDYVSRMKGGQKEIYFIAGPSREACERSPHLEALKSRGLEVLLMSDVIDDWTIPYIESYKGSKLRSVMKGDLDLSFIEGAPAKEEAPAEVKPLLDKIRAVLQEEVKDVRVTQRLADSPCCLVADEGDMDAHMERIMKAMHQETPLAKRILEINPKHALIRNLKALVEKNPQDARFGFWVRLLYNQAQIAEGSELRKPEDFLRGVTELLTEASGDAVK